MAAHGHKSAAADAHCAQVLRVSSGVVKLTKEQLSCLTAQQWTFLRQGLFERATALLPHATAHPSGPEAQEVSGLCADLCALGTMLFLHNPGETCVDCEICWTCEVLQIPSSILYSAAEPKIPACSPVPQSCKPGAAALHVCSTSADGSAADGEALYSSVLHTASIMCDWRSAVQASAQLSAGQQAFLAAIMEEFRIEQQIYLQRHQRLLQCLVVRSLVSCTQSCICACRQLAVLQTRSLCDKWAPIMLIHVIILAGSCHWYVVACRPQQPLSAGSDTAAGV